MSYRIISADSHIDLTFMPHDLFVSNAQPHLRERVPHVENRNGGQVWMAEGVVLAPVGFGLGSEETSPGVVHRDRRMEEAGFYEGAEQFIYHPTTPELRIKDQDMDGVDAEVIYGLSFGPENMGDPEVRGETYRIYNDWAAEFLKANPQRFAALSCVPHHNPEIAANELRRTAKMGLKGVELRAGLASAPIFDPKWDVLWSASDECDMPISFHIQGLAPKAPVPEDLDALGDMYWSVSLTMAQLDGVEFLSSIVFSGACERYSNFKFVLGECGVSWIPYVLDRMDHEGGGLAGLKMKPSDYWRRQGYSTFQKEGFVGDIVHLIGENNVMWGSDYPHHDGVWPDSQETIEDNLKNLRDEAIRRKVICENAGRLYGFLN